MVQGAARPARWRNNVENLHNAVKNRSEIAGLFTALRLFTALSRRRAG
jgi:hypothetical protein